MAESDRASLSAGTVLGFYWRASWRYPHLVIACALAVPFTVFVNSVLPPLIVTDVLNRLAHNDYQPGHPWESFRTSLIAYAVAMLAGGVVAWRLVDVAAWRLEAHVQRDLAQRCFNHIIKQSMDFHANRLGGSLVAQSTKLIGTYTRITDTFLFQTLPLLSSLTAVVVIMSVKVPLYSALLAVLAISYMTVAGALSRPVRSIGRQHAASESVQTGQLADAITNVVAVKSFAQERYEERRFAETTRHVFGSMLRLSRAHMRLMAYFGGITGTVATVALAVAVYVVVSLQAEVGTIFLIVSFTGTALQQLFVFSNSSLRTYNRAVGDASEMVEILATDSSVPDPARPESSRIGTGAITVDDVVFRYAGSTEPLFDGLSLTIAPGEKVGLVGHSGAGKTTLTRLLLRFSDVDAGRILIDGQDITAITQADLHAAIAYVPQDPLLFHRSIKENIAYGAVDADEHRIRLAARQANALGFIVEQPAGFDTLVGERGVKLSGGQRQRIAIARAMLSDAPILLLDEATSALDSESEALIQDALWTLMEGRTTIVVAHRLSTIQKMDRIIVMDEGRIVETGVPRGPAGRSQRCLRRTLGAPVRRVRRAGAVRLTRRTVLKPYAPAPGAAVGLVTPSSSIAGYPRRLRRSLHALSRQGFRPRLAPHARWEPHSPPSPAELASDIVWCCRQPDIEAIVCTTGGLTSSNLLPYLDYGLLRARRLPVCGLSDITALLLAIHAHSDLVVFHGPTLLPSFGDADGVAPYTAASLLAAWRPAPGRDLDPAAMTSAESLWWETEDHRPRIFRPAGAWRVLHAGSAHGRLLGGHLGTMCQLAGTPHLPELRGAVLFLETNEARATHACGQLEVLTDAGILDGATALVVGRSPSLDRPAQWEHALARLGADRSIPVLTDVDLGHTVPMLTLPVGVRVAVDTHPVRIRLEENAVVSRPHSDTA
ncbi:ATP-binding cassette domain-containing protein [Solwaraspora sp. WMMD406]|uniref:ATP-binding cassette domain-containing protein n=1 Tax=Solwaraspora sp. WMMD406 TaxID=3016095 RepID=UPI0024177A0B|nr:ATP-binding cassette domain-containing protein [Solwaraspora sp. WMMD406]MDG4763013.1 ATP-binding cassette domain-containing protein [Solwaraspora sp. WMMD406]